MSHLEEARFLILGLEPDPSPTTAEAAHLAECRMCAARLEEERRLTAELADLSLLEPPPDFVAKTTARYARAIASRQERRLAWIVAAALLLAPTVLLPMVAILVGNAGEILAGGASVVGYLVTVGHALLIVVAKLPQVIVVALCMISATALASSLLIGRLAVATAPAK